MVNDKDKQALLDALGEMPVVYYACKKSGVGRSTYYRWRQEDREFRRLADDAMESGREFVNDISESQLINLIKEKKMPAISLWLKHNNARYGSISNKGKSPSPTIEDLSPDEEKLVIEALEMLS